MGWVWWWRCKRLISLLDISFRGKNASYTLVFPLPCISISGSVTHPSFVNLHTPTHLKAELCNNCEGGGGEMFFYAPQMPYLQNMWWLAREPVCSWVGIRQSGPKNSPPPKTGLWKLAPVSNCRFLNADNWAVTRKLQRNKKSKISSVCINN